MATTMSPGGDLETKVKTLFTKIDKNGDGTITKDEAAQWFKNFGKISADAMFNEVDTDKSQGITMAVCASSEDALRPHEAEAHALPLAGVDRLLEQCYQPRVH